VTEIAPRPLLRSLRGVPFADSLIVRPISTSVFVAQALGYTESQLCQQPKGRTPNLHTGMFGVAFVPSPDGYKLI